MNHESTKHLRNIDIRRAILGVLSRERRPLSIGEVIDRLSADGVDLARIAGVSARQRVSDVLRYQRMKGRVERVARGRYRYVSGSVAHSTLWRCENWRAVSRR